LTLLTFKKRKAE